MEIDDKGEEMGQILTEVKIAFPVSHNFLTETEEQVKQQYCKLKVRSLSSRWAISVTEPLHFDSPTTITVT